jgi:riboflavin biosynthesis pyrimidine reductase
VSAEGLELLWEHGGLPAFDLPAELAKSYGGTIGFAEPRLFANFVATTDGVVAIPALPGSNRLIAAESGADRFVMGLLRACADAVVVGAGTFAASPQGSWTAARAWPAAAVGFAELRRRLGRSDEATLVVLSASGRVDPAHPGLAGGGLVLTTEQGARRLDGALPAGVETVVLAPDGALDPRAVVATLHARGLQLILSEGGPTVLAGLLAAGLVDELFLTVSPLLVGRPAGEQRLGLVEGANLLSGGPARERLLGVRRAGDHLFLRYALAGD